MVGCNKDIKVYIPVGLVDVKEITVKCGSTGYHGYPEFCTKCAEMYRDRDWRREAIENGENFDEEY